MIKVYDIPVPHKGGGDVREIYAYILNALPIDVDGMATQLIDSVPRDYHGSYRLADFACGCFCCWHWRVGIKVGNVVREGGNIKHDAMVRRAAACAFTDCSPLVDPYRPWPPKDAPDNLIDQLDCAELVAFVLEGGVVYWGNPGVFGITELIRNSINVPLRIIRG